MDMYHTQMEHWLAYKSTDPEVASCSHGPGQSVSAHTVSSFLLHLFCSELEIPLCPTVSGVLTVRHCTGLQLRATGLQRYTYTYTACRLHQLGLSIRQETNWICIPPVVKQQRTSYKTDIWEKNIYFEWMSSFSKFSTVFPGYLKVPEHCS